MWGSGMEECAESATRCWCVTGESDRRIRRRVGTQKSFILHGGWKFVRNSPFAETGFAMPITKGAPIVGWLADWLCQEVLATKRFLPSRSS